MRYERWRDSEGQLWDGYVKADESNFSKLVRVVLALAYLGLVVYGLMESVL